MSRPHNFLDNYGRPEFKLPYRWNDDTPLSLPLGPKSVHATSPYLIGIIDIRWDNPVVYAENNGLDVLGVNVYRCYDTPMGTYTKLNPSPVGALYYRDQTREVYAANEDPVSGGRLIAGTNATGDWIIHTYNKPIVIPGTNGELAEHPKHVVVRIKPTSSDPYQTVPAWRVVGETGEVFLINRQVYNHVTNKLDRPVLPDLAQGGAIDISYTYIDGWIQTDINRKVYYKATTVAIDPANPSVMIETPLNQVDAVSLYDMEKIDWVWAEAIRRNRWILEQGGERVKVFIRKWAGEKCVCWDDQYRISKNDCTLCFAPGTLVNTEMGWRPIESINAGDMVLSSDGYYHRVKGTICSPYKGNMLSILSSVNTNPMVVTPEHPFLVLRSTHNSHSSRGRKSPCGPKCNDFIERGDGNAYPPSVRKLPSGRWLARVQIGGVRGKGRVSLGTHQTREEAISAINIYKQEHWAPKHQLVWDAAKNINERDWLTPQWNSEIRDVGTVKIPDKFMKISKFGPKRIGATEFEVDSEFLWVVGMYIAEGSNNYGGQGPHGAGGGSIQFTLHKDEKVYQNRLFKFFTRYEYNPTISDSKIANSTVVVVNSSSLSKWFPEWLGHLCYNKHIPQELMYLPKDKAWMLIRGIYDGDGQKSDNEITQTSEILCLQLVELLHRVGEQPLVRRQISNVLTPIGNKRRPAYCVSWAEDNFTHSSRKRRWVFHDRVLAHVINVKKIDYEGPVYNLEVEGDPTYIVNGITSHNCFGTGYVGGYEGAYDLLVAPPETEKTVQLMDMGLHVNYDWTTFTGPYPLLNDRDFIVRQNNDRYSVAHVNPQGARGAIFQQHFTLAPLDQHDIRYRVPINGGISTPAAWNAYREGRPTDASPTIPQKPEIPDQYRLTGRTVTFESIMY